MRNYPEPMNLYDSLDEADEVEIEFRSERELEQYRQQLYKVNYEGAFLYRTRRIDRSVNRKFIPTLRISRLRRVL